MGKRSQLSIEEKTRILCWRAAGVTAKEMGERLGRNAMTIRRHIAAMKDLPSSATPPPAAARSGRPRVTSVPQDLRMKSYVQKNPFKTAKQLRKEVPGWGNVSVRTIQDRLKRELGLPARFFTLGLNKKKLFPYNTPKKKSWRYLMYMSVIKCKKNFKKLSAVAVLKKIQIFFKTLLTLLNKKKINFFLDFSTLKCLNI